jgi:hypothetical protein
VLGPQAPQSQGRHHAGSVTGNPVSVWVSAFGLMGEVTFFSVYDDVASAEAG